MAFYDLFFSGIYRFFLNSENRGRREISIYFAYTSILAIVLLEWIALFSLAILVGGKPFALFADKWFSLQVLGVLVAINWAAFLWRNRYRALIESHFEGWEERNRSDVRRTNVIVVSVLLFFILAVVVALNR